MIRSPANSKGIKAVAWQCHQEPWVLPACGSTVLGVLVLASGSLSHGFKTLQQSWFHITPQGHQSVMLPRNLDSDGPHACFTLCCRHFENLTNFIFELGFCEWSPVGQWSMPKGRGDIVCTPPPLLPHSHVASVMPVSRKSRGTHMRGSPVRLKTSVR